MSYTKLTWVNKETKLNATNMNHIEEGLEAAAKVADDAASAVTTLSATVETKQDILESGVNIKTLNGESILGEGDITAKTDVTSIADYIRFGIFTVNGEIVSVDDSKEIKLTPGSVYELTGCLKDAHILIDAGSDTDAGSANTQIILDGVYIESDTSRAIYCNQTKKKVVFTLTENSYNYITTAEETLTESKAVIECEGNGAIVTGKGSKLVVVAPNAGQHGIKMSRLYLSGLGTVDVDAQHDAFHGSKLIRIDSGDYIVTYAKDGFGTAETGRIQVFGGNIHFVHCEEDGFDSQGARYAEAPVNGVIAGWTARVTVESDAAIYGKEFNGMICLETIPEANIPTSAIPRTTLKDYFGDFVIKQGPKITTDDDFPTDAMLATYTDVEPVDGVYTITDQSVYIKGYTENIIVCTVKTTTVYGDDVCINSDLTCIDYRPDSKKLGFKGKEDAINLFISVSQPTIYSSSNIGFQKDANYLMKHNNGSGWVVRASGRIFTKGDGVKQFIGASQSLTSDDIHFGADKDDIIDDQDNTKFELSPTYIVSPVCADNVYFCYSQLGPVIANDIKATSISTNYSNGLSVIETDKSATLSYTVYNYSETDLANRFKTLDDSVTSLKNSVSYHSDSISTLKTNVATNTTDISTLNTSVSSLTDTVSAKQDKFTAGEGLYIYDGKLNLNLKTVNNQSLIGGGNLTLTPFTYTYTILTSGAGELTYNSTENALIFSSAATSKIQEIISAANNAMPVTLLCVVNASNNVFKFSLTYAAGCFTSMVRLVDKNDTGYESYDTYVTLNSLGLFIKGFDISRVVSDSISLSVVLASLVLD